MLHFSTLIILTGLILINLIGLMRPLPSQLKVGYCNWRIQNNRLFNQQGNGASEVGIHPSLKSQPALKMIAMSNQNRVYILSGQKIIYILNARFNLADRHCCVSVGNLRGTSIYHYDANGNSVKSSDWLSIGKSADFEARSQNNNKTNDTILLSKSDAKWLNANLPEHVEMIIYRLVRGKMDSLKNYGSGQICPSILPFAISYCFYRCFYMMD